MSVLDKLNEKYTNAMSERQIIQEEKDLMERRLIAADKLINGLSSENHRWKNDLADLEEYKKKIFGNCLLSSSFLAYTAPFSYEFRVDMFNNWYTKIIESELSISKPFKIEVELSDDVTIAKYSYNILCKLTKKMFHLKIITLCYIRWNEEGLPADDLSIQNGILTTKASRFPLCIDPQQQVILIYTLIN